MTQPRPLRWPAYILGFGMGGFFDGILLHQILQWHHLLSNVAIHDIRIQIAADGLFHALMYVITVYGLWRLAQARADLAIHGSDRALIADFLVGFGAWNVVDIALFHWILQIHHVRMNGQPILWDIVWLACFAGVPLVLARLIRTRGTPGSGGSATGVALALLVTLSGYQAARPPPSSPQVFVLFLPGTTPQDVFTAVAAVDGNLVWADRSRQVVALRLPDPNRSWELYKYGALFVGNSYLAPSCLAWLKSA